jgi:hypothetical protein
MADRPTTPDNFVTPNGKAKPEHQRLIRHLARLIRREHLDYDTFIYCCKRARRVTGLRQPKKCQ